MVRTYHHIGLEATRRYLMKEGYPEGYTKEEKNRLRKKARKFVLKGRKMFRINKNPDHEPHREVVIGQARRSGLILQAHTTKDGHYRAAWVQTHLTKHYYWLPMKKDIEKMLKYCNFCPHVRAPNPEVSTQVQKFEWKATIKEILRHRGTMRQTKLKKECENEFRNHPLTNADTTNQDFLLNFYRELREMSDVVTENGKATLVVVEAPVSSIA